MIRQRYIGWCVLAEDRETGRTRRVYRASSLDEAREMARELNQQFPARLYWAEYWSTSSFLNDTGDL